MKRKAKSTQSAHVEPQMKNTFTPRWAFPGPEFTRYGAAKEIAQFQSLHAGVK
ncbi:hypothetical protein TRAPUB_14236 [Trametes pubescens]|uniref:Uncharacterized protein n=1 Tax=Trametes pubescens TaxID=154538 RepID=A0A1M2VNY9_TRAPU|nr:hypothetical protein TRAPUB_14236 [Trametes pubescens]